jgi:hypothetical protein
MVGIDKEQRVKAGQNLSLDFVFAQVALSQTYFGRA